MYEGVVKTVIPDRGFGFISQNGGPDIFFHFRDLDPSLEFNDQLRERRVRFQVVESDRGPRAKNIRPVD
jgi:CspA family cold shock protein